MRKNWASGMAECGREMPPDVARLDVCLHYVRLAKRPINEGQCCCAFGPSEFRPAEGYEWGLETCFGFSLRFRQDYSYAEECWSLRKCTNGYESARPVAMLDERTCSREGKSGSKRNFIPNASRLSLTIVQDTHPCAVCCTATQHSTTSPRDDEPQRDSPLRY